MTDETYTNTNFFVYDYIKILISYLKIWQSLLTALKQLKRRDRLED